MATEKDPLRQSYAEMNQLRIEEKKNQLSTEFARYKQDCRKRALDAAMSGIVSSGEPYTHEKAIAAADKYYNWLISIPEK